MEDAGEELEEVDLDSGGTHLNDTGTVEVSLDKNPQGYFTGKVTVEQHYNGQNENRTRYAATMAVLQENGVEVAQSKWGSYVLFQHCLTV